MARTHERISDATTLVTGALLLTISAMAVQLMFAPVSRVPHRATVVLEKLIVTPTRVYTYPQWALSRPLPARVRVALAEPPLRAPQHC